MIQNAIDHMEDDLINATDHVKYIDKIDAINHMEDYDKIDASGHMEYNVIDAIHHMEEDNNIDADDNMMQLITWKMKITQAIDHIAENDIIDAIGHIENRAIDAIVHMEDEDNTGY
ncbi:hypothetical protein CHS0354_032994 [Potamilus streckersoni]|uniref:Uncharacterized protein n=1 Tax=Potamilus streckersoni TaxID=2493646 RepID=A0AAE0VKT0_9BIVA|nr:hypothetical protein CHS0354_032994 [Potamilus streckersoni]